MSLPERTGEDRLDYYDKLIACIVGDRTPSPEQEAQIEKLDFAWSLLRTYPDKHTVRKILESKYDIKFGQAYKIIRDAIRIYGNVGQELQEGTKSLYASKFLAIAQRAEEEGKLTEAISALSKAAKIEGAFDRASTEQEEDWSPPRDIEFTTDPAVFIESQKTHDVAHEVLPEPDDEEDEED